MKFPTMFSPVQIGTVTVPNRFVVPPMGNNLANTDGTLSDRSLSYYQARAKGGFGLRASAVWRTPATPTAPRCPSSCSTRAPRGTPP